MITLKCRVGFDEDLKALVVQAETEADTAVAFIVIGQALDSTGLFNSEAKSLWEQLRRLLVDARMPPTIVLRPGQEKGST